VWFVCGKTDPGAGTRDASCRGERMPLTRLTVPIGAINDARVRGAKSREKLLEVPDHFFFAVFIGPADRNNRRSPYDTTNHLKNCHDTPPSILPAFNPSRSCCELGGAWHQTSQFYTETLEARHHHRSKVGWARERQAVAGRGRTPYPARLLLRCGRPLVYCEHVTGLQVVTKHFQLDEVEFAAFDLDLNHDSFPFPFSFCSEQTTKNPWPARGPKQR